MGYCWSNVDFGEARIAVNKTPELPDRNVPVTAVLLADVRKLPASTLM